MRWYGTAVKNVAVEGALQGAEELMEHVRIANMELVTPMKRGPLRRSGRTERFRKGQGVRIVYGGQMAGYAEVQEKGYMHRGGKVIHFRKYTTPGTGKNYVGRIFTTYIGSRKTGLTPAARTAIQATMRSRLRSTP